MGQRAGSLRTEPESGRSSWSQGEAEKGAREEQKEEGVEGEPSQRAVRVWVGYRDPCTSNIPSGAWAPARHSCPAQRGWESVPAPWGGGAGPAHSTVAPGTRTARPLGPRGCLSLFTCLPSRGPCCWGLLGCLGRRGGRQERPARSTVKGRLSYLCGWGLWLPLRWLDRCMSSKKLNWLITTKPLDCPGSCLHTSYPRLNEEKLLAVKTHTCLWLWGWGADLHHDE